MKLPLKSAFIFCAFAALLWAPSCQTTCDNGYEGKRCDVPWRNKFKGVWSAKDTTGAINLAYLDTITDGNEVTDVYLSRSFSQYKFARAVRATINNNTISITNQKPDATRVLEGTGTLNSDRNIINLTYKITTTKAGLSADTVYTCVWTKQ